MPAQAVPVPACHASGLQAHARAVPTSTWHQPAAPTPRPGLLPTNVTNLILADVYIPALPRLNYAGYCRVCLRRHCTDAGCVTNWASFLWQPCPVCQGSGYADIACGADNACDHCEACTDGLIEAPRTMAGAR